MNHDWVTRARVFDDQKLLMTPANITGDVWKMYSILSMATLEKVTAEKQQLFFNEKHLFMVFFKKNFIFSLLSNPQNIFSINWFNVWLIEINSDISKIQRYFCFYK